MMASVSTLARSSGATSPVRTRNGCIWCLRNLVRLVSVRRLFDGRPGGLDVLAGTFDRIAGGERARHAEERQQCNELSCHDHSFPYASRRASTNCPALPATPATVGPTTSVPPPGPWAPS